MEIVNSYLNEIIFWVATFISGLSGTLLSLGVCAKSIVNIINLLKGTKGNYEEAINKVSEFGEKLEAIGKELNDARNALADSNKINASLKEENLAIKKALALMVCNDAKYIESGVSEEILDVLGLKEDRVEQVKIDE